MWLYFTKTLFTLRNILTVSHRVVEVGKHCQSKRRARRTRGVWLAQSGKPEKSTKTERDRREGGGRRIRIGEETRALFFVTIIIFQVCARVTVRKPRRRRTPRKTRTAVTCERARPTLPPGHWETAFGARLQTNKPITAVRENFYTRRRGA